ncbi:glutathionylspermidine synthase family protein [Alkalihalophilus lindianensis]|uniref:Glutathionylspermidine synthase family protein n=1 Tax=Alkalihalophilus lindianensis TaxID=1630542 RepID=A0ABU3XC93_9BACI|nr:glutathionylspermidine synthase family protein [Alkalihalophilus lindianensis]MDV2685232.1 glutathionylspermidine synthase family protein [Alkalihalophilus lindianensis]
MLSYLSLTKPFDQNKYVERFDQLYEKMAQAGFTWATLYENYEDHQYMTDSLLQVPYSMHQEIIDATRAVEDIYKKTFEMIRRNPNTIHRLGIPIMLWDLLLEDNSTRFSYFTRYDFIASQNGLKVIEANTDTPVGLVETAIAQRILAMEHQVANPHEKIDQLLKEAWEQIIKDYHMRSTDTLYITAANWHEEDKQTASYLMKHFPQQATYIPLEDIVVTKDGVFTPEGQTITYLYRLYPLEYFLNEKSDTGESIGEQFLVHVMNRKLMLFNPPAALLMQSKAIMALITEKKRDWYTRSEQEVIERYFLRTYDEQAGLFSYVKKPVLGREGGGIQIVENNAILDEDIDHYQEQAMVYQDYFPMPDQTIDTWDGPYTGKLLIGSHTLNGVPAGLFFRVGEYITGNLSMFVGYTIIK